MMGQDGGSRWWGKMVGQDRMFINDCNVDEVDFEISDESISEMVTYAMVDNFSVFNRR